MTIDERRTKLEQRLPALVDEAAELKAMVAELRRRLDSRDTAAAMAGAILTSSGDLEQDRTDAVRRSMDPN